MPIFPYRYWQIFIRGNGLFDIVNSTISARAQGALPHHQGGNLTIDSLNFLIIDKSQLLANAYAGNGGNIRIIAEQFIRSSESLLDASSELGLDGEIIIQSPDNDIENSLTVLPSRFLNADKLLKESCANRARPNLNLSHFFRKGRGGIRQSPENLLTHTPLQKSLGLSRH